MNNTEVLPPQTISPEDAAERLPIAEVAHVGSAIMHEEVTVEGVDQAMLDGDIEILEAQANGVDARREDAGRIHDIEQAYEAAFVENEIFDVYDEAKRENEIFDAHVEAIKEDEARTQAAEEVAKVEAEQQAAVEAQLNADQQSKIEEQIAASDVREQAQTVLRNVGYEQPLSAASQVSKDYQTGNLIIVEGNSVKVLDTRSNKPDITEYSFDKDTNVITIKAKGIGSIKARVGDYIPTTNGAIEDAGANLITLPPSVANMVGAKTAIPANQ